MTIVLHSEPATAEDAAKILGVSKARVKWLKKLTESRTAAKASGRKIGYKRGPKLLASAKRRKTVRGKAKKVAH